MLKTKFILAVASLAFAVSCTQSNNGTTESSPESTPNMDVNVSRLLMDGVQAPITVDFGSTKKAAQVNRQITITNDEAAPILISSVLGASDPSYAGFKITTNSCPKAPAKLAVGKSCVLTLSASPSKEGTVSGVSASAILEVSSGAVAHQVNLLVSITGSLNPPAATDADLEFVTVPMATTNYVSGSSQYKQVSVKNLSAVGTHPGNISIAADGWVPFISTCVAPLAAGKSCLITLSYSNWKKEIAPSFAYQAAAAGSPISSAVNPTASATTCTPGASRVLKAWLASDKKTEIVTSADVANASTLTRETVAQYSVGAAQVLEVCNAGGTAVAKALTSCASGFHKVEPKALANATASDFYCEPDTVTCAQ